MNEEHNFKFNKSSKYIYESSIYPLHSIMVKPRLYSRGISMWKIELEIK